MVAMEDTHFKVTKPIAIAIVIVVVIAFYILFIVMDKAKTKRLTVMLELNT